MKKELVIFMCIFVVLAFVMHHKEFLNFPLVHIDKLPNSKAYGFGSFHPLIFTSIVYTVLLFPRFIFNLLKRKNY